MGEFWDLSEIRESCNLCVLSDSCDLSSVIEVVVVVPVSSVHDWVLKSKVETIRKRRYELTGENQAHRLLFLINEDKPPVDVDADTVLQLDALCRQCMFSTMAKDLMLTVLKYGKTAKELWDHLKKLFKTTKLKSLSDRLLDLDFPMDDKRLVIQLVNGLPEEYNTVASFIQQSMPKFDAARSQLRTEEIRRSQQQSQSAPTALAAAATTTDRNNQRSQRGGHTRSGGHCSSAPATEPPLLPTPPSPYQLYGAPHPTYNIHCPPQWAVPPCPYPTSPNPTVQPPSAATSVSSSTAQQRPDVAPQSSATTHTPSPAIQL
ncbi:hypothetical protein C5167_000900 [Papaver somniferum]|uniref:Uncharacterized protein n=1 Tax=Papaver somniferum TaxID=3469 RepID=A0A4Y7KTN6_PAPSO|nr:hypothetical protein C5167_000900 [Papaver somniferum]